VQIINGLYLARTPPPENNQPTEEKQVQTLSLYITSLMVDFPHEYETSASMMTAIKCQDDRVGERGARAEWIWEFWQDRWKFRLDSEVWGLFIAFVFDPKLTKHLCSVYAAIFVESLKQPQNQRDRFIRNMCTNTLPYRVSFRFLSSHPSQCIVIPRPIIPQQPAAFYVPRDLLEGLEASLDNASQ
jgi:hypothetical protein